jgi:hypothetical protein
MARVISLLVLLLFVGPLALGAQTRSNTEGWLLNAHVGGAAGNVEDGSTEAGLGGGMIVGYGFTPEWQVFVGGDATSMDISNPELTGGYTIFQGDVGARLNFPDPTATFVAYVIGAVTGQFAKGTITGGEDVSADAELKGWGGTIGTGFHVFFNPALALDTQVQFTFGQFTHADLTGANAGRLDNALQNWVTRLNVGLTWYPQAPY